MPSQRFHFRKRIHTPDPRLLSDGRRRSLSPPLEGEAIITSDHRLDRRSPSPPLEEEAIIAQIVLMFSMDDPRPDSRGVQFLLHELKAVGLPYHIIFNKIDLVEPEAITEWELRLQTWGGCPVSFISLHSHLGLQDLHKVFIGKSSLLLGLHNVGKTSLVHFIAKNRSTDARYDVNTVIKQVDKWLVEKCDASRLMKEDLPEDPHLRPYCLDLYKDKKSGNEAFLVSQKGWIIKKMLETDAPVLAEMVNWASRIEEAEEYLYFTKYCPEKERVWWRELKGDKGVSLLHKKLEKDKGVSSVQKKLLKDYHLRGLMQMLHKACLNPCEEHEDILGELLKLVNESQRFSTILAHGPPFIATAVTLMLVGQESTQIATARLLYALADVHYTCKVLVGELGGFHALTALIQFGTANARAAAIQTLCVLLSAEENWRKVLMTGVPETVIGMLAEDKEGALSMVSRVFNEIGSFDLAWDRFFTAAIEEFKDTSTALYNAVMHSLLRIKHTQNLRIEYLEGSQICERSDDSLDIGLL